MLLSVPRENPVTASQMLEMQELAKEWSELPVKEAETLLLLNRMFFQAPEKFMKFIKSLDCSIEDIALVEEYVAMIEGARVVEKKLAN